MSIKENIDELMSENSDEFIQQRIKQLVENNPGAFYESYKKMYYSIKPGSNSIRCYEFFFDPVNTHISFTAMPGAGDSVAYLIDATEEITKDLAKELKLSGRPNNIQELTTAVTKVVLNYFGGEFVEGGDKERLSHFNEDEDNYISQLKGTKHAFCSERASLAHQLFKILGLKTKLVSTPIVINGVVKDIHFFNLIKTDDGVFLYDASILDYSKENYLSGIADIKLQEKDYEDPRNIGTREYKNNKGEIKTICYCYPKFSLHNYYDKREEQNQSSI